MKMGRPPKPMEDHDRDGTRRRDRHGDAEVFRADGEPERPDDLDGWAAWLWDHVLGDLRRADVARRLDGPVLGDMCRWYARYRRAAEALDAMEPTADGAYRMMIQTNLAWKTFAAMASEFGLTPVARSRMRIESGRKEQGVQVRMRKAG